MIPSVPRERATGQPVSEHVAPAARLTWFRPDVDARRLAHAARGIHRGIVRVMLPVGARFSTAWIVLAFTQGGPRSA